jgi:hypothetical protein
VTERHNDRVRIALGRGIVELPWASRVALLDEIRNRESAKPIVDAFEAVGTSRPVTLTLEQKDQLVDLIESWDTQTERGLKGLPEGLFELRNALHDDLHDAPRDSRLSVEPVRASNEQCVEGGRVWVGLERGWQHHRVDLDETALYCPDCAEREFG